MQSARTGVFARTSFGQRISNAMIATTRRVCPAALATNPKNLDDSWATQIASEG